MSYRLSLFLLVVLGLASCATSFLVEGAEAIGTTSTTSFAITSISVDGTNLVLNVVVPPGLQQVILETRAGLNDPWMDAGVLEVPATGGEATFIIPKPPTPIAFFRLKAGPNVNSALLVSAELQYATMPSLASNLDTNGDAIFHFKGSVDGSDRIVITHEGALWSHVNWDWPTGPVSINGTTWNSKAKNYLTTVGTPKFLPEAFSLASADLEILSGRDTVALECTNDAVTLYLDDTPSGADTYEFKIHFHRTVPKPTITSASSKATLKFAAQIDGSDCLKITTTEATWQHKFYAFPGGVSLNGHAWNPQLEPVLENEGTNQFLPVGIDFSTARVLSRQGRDVAAMTSSKDAIWLWFADNPNGDDAYEMEISFGQ